VKPDYTVRLERVFQGPMDLLLHLVREQEVEIHEIEIARILDGYLAYLDTLDSLDIEYAGDFLVMAATLMAIKSRSLLPNEEIDLEDEIDPRDELIQRLLEYRRFRDAGDRLEAGWLERSRQSGRGWHDELDERVEPEFDLGELTPWDLLTTFSRLMRETLADRPHHVTVDPRPLRYYIDQVVLQLRGTEGASLGRLLDGFGPIPRREALIGSFCALLELVRLDLVEIRQEEGRDIAVAIRPERAADIEEVVRRAVLDEEVLAAEAEAALQEHAAGEQVRPPEPGGAPAG